MWQERPGRGAVMVWGWDSSLRDGLGGLRRAALNRPSEFQALAGEAGITPTQQAPVDPRQWFGMGAAAQRRGMPHFLLNYSGISLQILDVKNEQQHPLPFIQ